MTAIFVLSANMDALIFTPHTKDLFDSLSISKARQVCVKTLNDLGRDAERAAKDHVKKTYNLKGGLSKRGFKRRRANNYRLSVRLEGEFARTPLMEMRGTKQGRSGVRTAIRRGAPVILPRSFISSFSSVPRVWQRVGKARLPIKKIGTVSFGKMFSTREAEPIYIGILKNKTEEYLKKHLMTALTVGIK